MADTILISRTDSIGDVVLTLPICAWLKKHDPNCYLIFLGQGYTKPILDCYSPIDEVLEWDKIKVLPEKEQLLLLHKKQIDTIIHVFPDKTIAKLAKKAEIKIRIGTSHRVFHWPNCNIRPNFTRKNSNYHEAQLNFELLGFFGLKSLPSIAEIKEFLSVFKPQIELEKTQKELLQNKKKKIILHPRSKGSAIEWPIENYIELAKQLVQKDCVVYFSGTEMEGKSFRNQLPKVENIIDITGKFSLGAFITFISQCDALVACSTGPLHIAAAIGINAIGLYSDLRPIHPGRWMPLGKKSTALTVKTKNPPKREDIYHISIENVLHHLINSE